MLDSYRAVLAMPRHRRFSAAGLVARLPISMGGLGLVLLISAATGSYALAGAVSAVYLAANAVLSVLQGRLLDRWGQAPVLTVVGSVFATSMLFTALSVELAWPLAATYLSAAAAGATLPAIGACVRARWAHVLSDPAQVRTAYALEGVVDEVVFITGPILVTALATAWHPVAGLAAAAAAGLVGTLALAAQRATQPEPHRPSPVRADRPSMRWGGLLAVAAVCVGLGALFGAAEVSAVAFAESRGAKGVAGVLLALWAAGSLIAGVATGAVSWRRGPGTQLRWSSAALALAMTPLPLIGSLPVMGLALFLGGFAIAPTLISANSLIERTVPRSRLSEGISVAHTGIVAGAVPGAAIAGALADASGPHSAFAVSAAAGLLAALAAQFTPR